jgi:hypothetical protein
MMLDSSFRGEPGFFWLVLCLTLLAGVAAVDYATDLNVSILYLAPVSIAAWTYGHRPTVLIALFWAALLILFLFIVHVSPTHVQGAPRPARRPGPG